MPISTVLVLIAAIGLFALVAIALAFAQLHTRDITIGPAAPGPVHHPRRRPF